MEVKAAAEVLTRVVPRAVSKPKGTMVAKEEARAAAAAEVKAETVAAVGEAEV